MYYQPWSARPEPSWRNLYIRGIGTLGVHQVKKQSFDMLKLSSVKNNQVIRFCIRPKHLQIKFVKEK